MQVDTTRQYDSFELSDDAIESHSRWSKENLRFLEHVLGTPEALERSSYVGLQSSNPLPNASSVHPWPIFMDERRAREIESVTVGLDRLLKSIPERFFGCNPERVGKFYQFDRTDLLAVVLAQPDGIRGALSRGDYAESREGWKCLELNVGGQLGGWHGEVLEDLYLESPGIDSFLKRERLEAHHRKTFRWVFSHLVRNTLLDGVWDGGDLNLAIILYPHTEAQIASFHFPDRFQREYELALEETGRVSAGQVFLCGYDDLAVDRTFLRYRGQRVHAVLEQHNGTTDRVAFRCFKAGGISLFSGPVTMLLSDKRNLALLSERARSSDFTEEERELIERHIPWTRQVTPGPVVYQGKSVRLPDLLSERRQDMVLKKAQSLGGLDVRIGSFLAEAEWQTALAKALKEGGWIVQERVELLPYIGQQGERGCAPYDVIWGHFVCAERYGGTYVRMLPREKGGPVSLSGGASIGAILEIAPSPGPPG